jgi:hypothetical protein
MDATAQGVPLPNFRHVGQPNEGRVLIVTDQPKSTRARRYCSSWSRLTHQHSNLSNDGDSPKAWGTEEQPPLINVRYPPSSFKLLGCWLYRKHWPLRSVAATQSEHQPSSHVLWPRKRTLVLIALNCALARIRSSPSWKYL